MTQAGALALTLRPAERPAHRHGPRRRRQRLRLQRPRRADQRRDLDARQSCTTSTSSATTWAASPARPRRSAARDRATATPTTPRDAWRPRPWTAPRRQLHLRRQRQPPHRDQPAAPSPPPTTTRTACSPTARRLHLRANGELRHRTTSGETTTYNYDAPVTSICRPARRQRIEYLVDGNNRRVGRKVDGVLVAGLALPGRPQADRRAGRQRRRRGDVRLRHPGRTCRTT